jgi:hypothetical protein
MRSDQYWIVWNQSLKKLKEKWTNLKDRVFHVLAEEEMKFQLEELENHAGRSRKPDEPQESLAYTRGSRWGTTDHTRSGR